MFLRIRWFAMGAAVAAGALGYVANELRKAREKMTPRNMANTGMKGVAHLFDTAAGAIKSDPEGRP